MGVVYKAEDTRLKRFVALKFLPPELTTHPVSRERFMHEAQAAGSLDHANICTIYEIDETPDGQVFICMAYVDGEALRARLARGPLAVEDALAIAIQAAAGLGQAHRHGVVHRDIKPGNLMLTRDGTVKIVDFGLASLTGHARLTMTGQVVGTASYISPEQARGAGTDCRSDFWSLGVVIYEMLSGRLPFGGDSDVATLHAVVYDNARPLAELRSDLPPQLLAAVARCLAKDPGAALPDRGGARRGPGRRPARARTGNGADPLEPADRPVRRAAVSASGVAAPRASARGRGAGGRGGGRRHPAGDFTRGAQGDEEPAPHPLGPGPASHRGAGIHECGRGS